MRCPMCDFAGEEQFVKAFPDGTKTAFYVCLKEFCIMIDWSVKA